VVIVLYNSVVAVYKLSFTVSFSRFQGKNTVFDLVLEKRFSGNLVTYRL